MNITEEQLIYGAAASGGGKFQAYIDSIKFQAERRMAEQIIADIPKAYEKSVDGEEMTSIINYLRDKYLN